MSLRSVFEHFARIGKSATSWIMVFIGFAAILFASTFRTQYPLHASDLTGIAHADAPASGGGGDSGCGDSGSGCDSGGSGGCG